jgi:hypothetical protein
MKKLIKHDVGNYTFNPVAKTITLWGVQITQDQILTITNTTDGTLIYVFADPTLGGTFDGTTLTLAYDTSSMSDTDALQIYVDIPDILQSQKLLSQLNIGDVVLLQDESSGELYTQDRNLANILGGVPVTDNDGYLKDKVRFDDKIVSGRLGVAQEALGIDCKGYSTVAVELSGTWAGTITFEGRTDTGNYVVINGMAANGTTLVSTTTGNGVFRFSTAGIIRFQIRFSAFTSGTLLATLEASAEIGAVALSAPVSGSQTQPLTQRATSFELTTYDTNMASTLGTSVLYRLGNLATNDPIVAPTVNITPPTTYADNRYVKYPQIQPRLRVEVGGDQKLPLAQEVTTNRLLISQPEIYAMLEAILLQLKILNQMYVNVNGNTPPPGWEEVK